MHKLKKQLKKWWDWLVRQFTGGRPPDNGPPLRKITNVNVEIDMAGDVTLSWDNPTERADGVPADGSEFEIRVGMKAAAAPDFTPLQVVEGIQPPLVLLNNQAGGDYEFELVLHDLVQDKSQAPIIAPFTVPAGDLNPLTNVDVQVA
jgi:hypothetical protein